MNRRLLHARSCLALLICAFAVVLVAVVVTPGAAQDPPVELVRRETFHVPGFESDRTERVVATWLRRPDGQAFAPGEKLPVLVALHGAQEATYAAERAALAWSLDYQMDRALAALKRGSLSRDDFGGLVRATRLTQINRELSRRPFRGLIVLTPRTPNLLSEPVGAPRIAAYADWIVHSVLGAARGALPVAEDRAGTGIDGVSLGGRLALEIGWLRQDVFGAVGALQPAIRGQESALARAAVAGHRRGQAQATRIVTSDGDPGLPAARALFALLGRAHIASSLTTTPGTHGYEFNRGPGALEMLFWHDRTLRVRP